MTELGNLEYYEIVFPKLGLEFTVKSVAFTLFGMQITWYGLIITLGMILAMLYGFSRMRRHGIDPDRAIDGVIGGIVGGIVGARIYYVIFNWSDYSGNWKNIFNVRGGGLAIYGGLIGALVVGGLVCKLRKVRILPMLDIVGPSFLIGQCLGRWGNFTNHEAFGSNTDSLFGMSSGKIQAWITTHNAELAAAQESTGDLSSKYPVHPCFLYESVWCLIGFCLLAYLSRKHRKFDGQIFLLYIAWYGLGRFFIEGLRTDSLYIGTLRVSQVLAAVSVVVSVVLLIVFGSKVKRMGGDYVLYCDTKESKQLLAEADAKAMAYQKKKENDEELEDKMLSDEMPADPTGEDPEPELTAEKAKDESTEEETEDGTDHKRK